MTREDRPTMLARLLVPALVAGCLLTPGTAAAQDSGGTLGSGVEVRAVTAIAPLRTDNGDRAERVYDALLPNGYTAADERAVGFWLADLAFGSRAQPFNDGSHWLEGAVQLRVKHKADDGTVTEGWYPIHYPVTAEFWFNAGRYVGLPKRHATAASPLAPDGTQIKADGLGWSAIARATGTTGAPSYQLDWQPDPTADAAAAFAAFRVPFDPLLVLNAPMEGPNLEMVQYSAGAPSGGGGLPAGPPGYNPETDRGDAGTVRVSVRDDLDALQEADLRKLFPPGTSMRDLVALDQRVPGTHSNYTISLGSSNRTIGKGGYSSDKPQPLGESGSGDGGAPSGGGQTPGGGTTPPGQGGEPVTACQRRSAVTLRFRVRPGLRVRRVRARIDGRVLKTRVLRGRRVRVDLRGVGAGRRTVRIIVMHRGGRPMLTRRAVRTCVARRTAA